MDPREGLESVLHAGRGTRSCGLMPQADRGGGFGALRSAHGDDVAARDAHRSRSSNLVRDLDAAGRATTRGPREPCKAFAQEAVPSAIPPRSRPRATAPARPCCRSASKLSAQDDKTWGLGASRRRSSFWEIPRLQTGSFAFVPCVTAKACALVDARWGAACRPRAPVDGSSGCARCLKE